jgi:hypothetical protein
MRRSWREEVKGMEKFPPPTACACDPVGFPYNRHGGHLPSCPLWREWEEEVGLTGREYLETRRPRGGKEKLAELQGRERGGTGNR